MRSPLRTLTTRALAFALLGTGLIPLTVAGGATPATAADPLPVSDPTGSGNWVYSPAYSDDFGATSVDTAKWQPMPLTYSDVWRWDAGDIAESGGNLSLNSEYAPNDSFNETPAGWQTVSADSWSPLADYVTTTQHRSGSSALVHYNYWSYDVTTRQKVSSLADGTYTFSAWVWTGGANDQTQSLVADNCGSTNTATSLSIPRSNGAYTLYTLSGIKVTGGSCSVGLKSASNQKGWTRLDDASFTADGGSTNLLTNPGFETRVNTPYQSGGVISLDTIKYGYVEASIKASATAFPGTCPAFWLEHIDPVWGNEIDIEEIGQSTSSPKWVSMTDHNWKSPTSTTLTSHTGDHTAGSSLNGSFHTYGLEWGPGYLKFYVDGVLARTYDNTDYNQTGMNIILSQGIRSPYTSSPTATGFPATSQIGYVHVWKKADMEVDDADMVRGATATPQVPGDGQGEDLFRYGGTWAQNSDSSAYTSTTHTSSSAGATSTVEFYGTGVSLVGATGPAQGQAEVSVDGGTPVGIDEYAATAAAQQTVFSSTGLSAGHHTLTLTVSGTSRSASTGTAVSVDAAHVLN
ncbi:family 16 glycosylhydrolase [Streptomyces sp. NPDC087270]|uniref:glycoside hydrolase family 16 protein n=1 Tax=Streptomyces sp. NPDC087270 TaxID=3365774 RepID=UPI0037F5502F